MPLNTLPAVPAQEEDRAAILVVDDLPEKLLVFRTVLEELGQELVCVRSGGEALRELLQREFAVILLDVNMPNLDGFETADLIRRYKRTAHTPIIFITAYADEVQTHRGYELGAVDYILWPVVPAVLRSKVQVFVDLHVMQRRIRRQAQEHVALAAAQAARQVAEHNTRRAAFLAEASRVLGGSLDIELTQCRLLQLLVPALAPCAALVGAAADGAPDRVLLCQASPEGPAALSEHRLRELHPLARRSIEQALRAPAVCRMGPPHALDEDEGEADEAGEDGAAIDAPRPARRLHLPAGAVAALRAGDTVTGALYVAGLDDDALLHELAGRATMAFENAELYRNLQLEIVERRQAEERLRQSNRRKDEFLAMLSHELRNPLAPIRNAVEVIRRLAPADPKLAWATDVTDRQVSHLTRLVAELLDVARISQGKIDLQMEPVDLLAVVGHSVETARPGLDARGHRLLLQLPHAPVWLRGDAARLAQVVGNLLNNAAKYTPDGGVIQVSLQAQGGQARITVRDNGIGIEAALLPNVFELFEQGQRSLDRSQGGLGVGLTLVQRLVALHQGAVQAHSAGPGQGAAFTVCLPCLAEVPAEPAASGLPMRTAAPRTRRVLVVDDNSDAADTVALFLRLDGHSVETAGDGPQALARADAFVPDVVVLDIGLPGIDGYEVARRLRSDPRTRDVLLVALTGYGQQADTEEAQRAGFDHHLVKPADPALLAELIAAWAPAAAVHEAQPALPTRLRPHPG